MPHNEKPPALAGAGGSGNVEAGEHDGPDHNNRDCSFQSIGDLVARIIARRHGLSLPTAAAICGIVGIGGQTS